MALPTSTERFQALKDKVDRLQRDANRAEGALEQSLLRLRREHKCPSLEAAKKKLRELEGLLEKAEKDFNKAADDFEAKWAKELEDE